MRYGREKWSYEGMKGETKIEMMENNQT